ncbi:MAG: hypothetical protein R8L53_09605, partial [Mariprofundales bacterium]
TILEWQKPATINAMYNYTLKISSDNGFVSNLQTLDVKQKIIASNMPLMLGIAFGMLAFYRRKIVLTVAIISCAVLISCNSGGVTQGGSGVTQGGGGVTAVPTQTITVGSLLPATTYYWKIVVTDPVTGVTASSKVDSFTTQ